MMFSRISRRKMVFGSAAILASTPVARFGLVAAQTEYSAPDNIDELSGSFEADGSSTVGPFTEAVIEEFAAVAPGVTITNGISGTGGGFKRFVEGETALSNASRPIADDEVALAAENGVSWYEFEVCYDGLSVVVNPENDWVESLTVEQLNELWKSDSAIVNWSDLNPEWPEEVIELYGPGADSGTFDYFNEVILGDDASPRTDYIPSEDDNVLVQGVAGSRNALGYFGYAYYVENQDSLRVVPIDGGSGPVEPTIETIADGSYAPLSRPLFEYVNGEMLQTDPALQEFMRFMLANSGPLAEDVGYVALPGDLIQEQQDKLEGAISGEVAPDSEGAGEAEASPAA
jgi:phosphate transport system substrate-binding protein